MKGIEYTADNVLKIIRRQKTQTRRPIKFPKHVIEPPGAIYEDGGGNWVAWDRDVMPAGRISLAEFTKRAYPNGEGFPCKYGKAGDRLYVKEELRRFDTPVGPMAIYGTDNVPVGKDGDFTMWKWKPNKLPPRYMPTWAARVTIEITNVRAQRLQDISEEDAIAEGCLPDPGGLYWCGAGTTLTDERNPALRPERVVHGARGTFGCLWNLLYGDDAWAQSPWVWAITFKLVNSGGENERLRLAGATNGRRRTQAAT